MITTLFNVPAIARPVLIHAPRPTLPPASYRDILEGDWEHRYDCKGENNTEQEHKSSAPETFDETIPSQLGINSPCIVLPKLPEKGAVSPTLWGHSESEKMLPVRKERQRSHKTSSLLSSLSSTSSLDIAEVHTVECGEREELGSILRAAEILRWSDEVLQWGPVVKQIPTTLPSLQPDTTQSELEWEKPAVSRLTKWSTRAQKWRRGA
ncbi:hypothetical protein B0H21DRAFT_247192 [Amylocystis lapponica]|nr:hypothetical protein B0H21DRAFT_247192 [Amylocystis lapponica]